MIRNLPFRRQAGDIALDRSGRVHWFPFEVAWAGAGRFGEFFAIATQVGLVLLAAHLFQIEEAYGFGRILPLIFAGFVVHAGLSLPYRLPFFLLLSLAAIGVIFGYPHGVGLIGLGLGLIGICHLPIAFAGRVALLVAAGILLGAIRAEWIQTSWESLPTLVLPILGSMFMFRLIVYMYDLRHEKKPASVWERLSYFFLLPNVCFPLFPVVDYQTFRRTYYNADAHEIYQKGVVWMLRGVIQLLLYRVVYHYLVPSPAEVQGLGGVVQSMVSTYLLYLRISGQFHLIIGILCLFGFNLPETHHLYYLASSFNDYWRRINIYWKDFMMKIFYYPAFVRLRKWGMTTGLTLATLTVFLGTWLLHSYQWFWLRGTFPLSAPDALFWGILGGLVVANSLYEARRGRKRSLTPQGWTFGGALVYSLKVIGMFVFITILWSLWSSPSVGEWWSLVSIAGESEPRDFGLLLLVLLTLAGVGVFVQYANHRGWRLPLAGSHPSFGRSVIHTGAIALLLVLVGLPGLSDRWGGPASELVVSLRTDQLNQQDKALMERGYYEGLLDAEKYTSALWTVQKGQPRDWKGIGESEASRQTGDLLAHELLPSYEGVFKRAEFRTNQWGMRDQEYQREKPPHTYRIALLGSSYVMGAGVADDQTFEALVEDRLNRERTSSPYPRYEILNFAVGGYGLLENVVVAEKKVFPFGPDAVFYVAHVGESRRWINNASKAIRKGVMLPHPELQEIIRRSGVDPSMERAEIERRLRPLEDEFIRWSYERIVAITRKHGAVPVWIYLPLTHEAGEEETRIHLSRLAQEAGFATWSLTDAYKDHDRKSIQVAPWDDHPNAQGHQLLADRLYQVLRENEQLLDPGNPERNVEESLSYETTERP